MKLFEDLKQKYPIKNIPPYGECIVVPGPDFDTDFEVELGDEGYPCINTDLDGKPVTPDVVDKYVPVRQPIQKRPPDGLNLVRLTWVLCDRWNREFARGDGNG